MTTLLNVDDNNVSRYARTRVLRQAGFEVLEATTGRQALALVNEVHPALVLLDVNLPDVSGLDVCRQIKADPHAASTPVLHISATAVLESDLVSGLQAADAYLTEPVPPEVLVAFVRSLLRGRELLREWVGVFDALADGVALLSAEGSVLRCNSAFCRLLGKRVGEVIGRNILEAVSAARCDAQDVPFPRSIRTQQSQNLECSFGDRIYRLTCHLATVHGSVAGAIYIISDVTEQRRAARQKDEALALLHGLTDAAPVGFVFFDLETRYRFVNKELADINGLPIEAHFGRTPEEIALVRAAEVRRLFETVTETGDPILDHEFETGRHSGNRRSWSERWFPVRSASGTLIGVGATIVETTERKRAERSREEIERRMLDAQKLESIGLLAGGIAHDFNNLLTGILGNASMAEEFALPETQMATLLEEIVNASERAAHLTRQMLAYSGKGQFVVESIDLSRETEEVVRLVQASISKKINLRLELPSNLPSVQADKGQLQQVIMNIVVNASEAIGDAKGLLSIRTGLQRLTQQQIQDDLDGANLEPGKYLYLEVSDSGCGMDDATKTKIFDPFFTTKFTGRGLGLAAVSGIVRSHKGTIRVKSSPGKGSTFQVYFPAASEPASATHPVWPQQVPFRGSPGEAILVVDDESVVLRIAQSALKRHGYEVLVAESGTAAIDLFRQQSGEISLIILDLSMPGMSGLEALPELRKIRADISVIISSGYSEAETLKLFYGQDITGFLQKPYTSHYLLQRVEAAVAKQQKRILNKLAGSKS